MAAKTRPLITLMPAIVVIAGVVGYSVYLDQCGTLISGKVWMKRELIRFRYGQWTRQFSVTATYQPAGELIPSYANTDVNADTFDGLRVGSPVMVRYIPSHILRQIPMIPSSRLTSRTTFSFISDWSAPATRLGPFVLALALLVVLWRKAGMLAAGALLVLGGGIFVIYLILPFEEPAPEGPVRTAMAKVERVAHVKELLRSRRRRTQSIALRQPFDMVDLEFVPEGRIEPVHAVDKVDAESVPGMDKGAKVAVTYEAQNPRIARINAGTRTFPAEAFHTFAFGSAGLLLIVILVWAFLRAITRSSAGANSPKAARISYKMIQR